MKNLTNKFTIVFILAIFASFYQLGTLTKGITMSFANSISETITPTMPTVTPVQPIKTFIPERMTIADAGIDLLVFPQPLKDGDREVLTHAASYAEGTDVVNDKQGTVGIYVEKNIKGVSNVSKSLTGSDIILYGKNEKALYRIVAVSSVSPKMENVFASTENPTMTLVVVDGTFDKKTYLVKAKLVKIENHK